MGISDQAFSSARRPLGIGILGYGNMGRAHSSAFHRLPQFFSPLPLKPRLVAVAARSEEKAAYMAERFGFATWYRGWEELVADERVELFDNTGPNHLHAEPCIAAARAGKPVICDTILASAESGARVTIDYGPEL